MDSEHFIRLAIEEAALAERHDDVPVGAVVVINGAVVSQRHNERELTKDPTAHAEVLALRDAAAVVDQWRLSEADIYVSLEPCTMCAGAIVNARIRSLTYAAADLKAGAAGSLYNLCTDPRLNHEVTVTSGVMGEEAAAQLRRFFAMKRAT